MKIANSTFPDVSYNRIVIYKSFLGKHFQTSKTSTQSSNILLFAIFGTYYNSQSINWTSIGFKIKINLEKALIRKGLKVKFPGHFFEKVVLLGISEFHGLQDNLKIIWKKLTQN